jgi:predicted Zn-dependent protease
VTGAASTVGCLNETADSLRTWRRRDGGPSQVLFSVFVKVRPDLDDELLERVVAHEAGHVLGILAHSLDARDLMWAGDLSSASPSGADRQTLRSLYQAPVDLSY